MPYFAFVLLLGLFLSPLLEALARRLFMRLGHPLVGFPAIAVVALLFPVLALAQAAPAATATPSAFESFLNAYLPKILEAILVGVLIPLILKGKAWLNATADSKDASAGKQLFARAMLPIEHLAEVFAANYQHALEANPTANKAQLLQAAGDDFKQTLGTDGAAALQQELGFGGDALAKYLQGLVAQKLQSGQLTAATAAGVAAGQKVQVMPLNQVAAALAAGPAKAAA